MAAKQTFTTERWIYIGKRRVQSGKLADFFLDPKEAELGYSKTNASVVGGIYEVEVDRSGDGVTCKSQAMVYQERADNVAVANWEAEHRAVTTADLLRKREDKDKKDQQFGKLTLDELREQMTRLPHPQKVALTAQILRYVG